MFTLSRKKLFLYKIVSIIALLFFIVFLRYCGGVKLFCAQNGSIFEIAKITFWAMLIYGFFEFLIPGFADRDNIFFGKLAAIVSAPILAAIFLLIFPQGFTLVALAIILSVIIAQIIEWLFTKTQPNCALILVTVVLFLIFFVCFIVFSYHPLGNFLFRK